MKRFAVIGHPIGHSLSPLMHNTAFSSLGLDCSYELMDIDPIDLKKSMDSFRKEEWGGFNVTVPHKEAVIPLINEVTPEARTVGAVNTVMNRNGILSGYNTDVIGIERSLETDRKKIEGQKCVIMGAGGAARSVTYILINRFKAGSIVYAALYPEQGEALIKSIGKSDVNLSVVPFTEKAIADAVKGSSLIVNATVVGMYPKVQDTPISDKSLLSERQIVFDLTYRPLKTRLLKEAEDAGAKTIGGLDMFIHQGAAAFEIWTGKKMPVKEVRNALEEKLTR